MFTVAQGRIDAASQILDRQIGWISAADSKAGFVVAIDTAMLAGLAAAYDNAKIVEWMGATSTIAAVALTAASVCCAAAVVISRTRGPKDSLIFFGPIAKMDPEEYCSALKSASEETLLADYCRQIHRNAEIASLKHSWSGRSIRLGVGASVAWAIAISTLIQG